MSFKSWIRDLFGPNVTLVSGGVIPGNRRKYDEEEIEPSMTLSAVYRCVNVISDAVSTLPLHVYKVNKNGTLQRLPANDKMNIMLNLAPDGRMTRATLMKQLVMSKLLRGNGYAWIDRASDGTINRIVYLDSMSVEPTVVRDVNDHGIEHVEYNVAGFDRRLQGDEMIHILNFSRDGLTGVSTVKHAITSLDIADGGEHQALGYFEGEGVPSGILSVEGGRLRPEDREKITAAWEQQCTKKGGLVVLEGHQHYTPIAISPADAQLLESRGYSVVEICRFFGVSPVKCFDLTKSSYSTVEATELAFTVDTLNPILTAFEQEFDKKLFIGNRRGKYVVRYDREAILVADKAAQASYYSTMSSRGIFTPNEIRAKLGYGPIKGGDSAYMQTAMAPMEQLGAIADAKNDIAHEGDSDEEDDEPTND